MTLIRELLGLLAGYEGPLAEPARVDTHRLGPRYPNGDSPDARSTFMVSTLLLPFSELRRYGEVDLLCLLNDEPSNLDRCQ